MELWIKCVPSLDVHLYFQEGRYHNQSKTSSPGPGDGLRLLLRSASQSELTGKKDSLSPSWAAGSDLRQPDCAVGLIHKSSFKELTCPDSP